nr:helix-turn-helix transcriptional regulator [Streptomyces sp. SID3343]
MASRRFGREMARLRKRSGINAEQAGLVIEVSDTKMSRMENGKTLLKRVECVALLDRYRATEQEKEALLAMSEAAKESYKWLGSSAVIPSGLGTLINIESEAAHLSAFNSTIILGLLQTEEYARATIVAHCPDEPNEVVEGRVQLRMQRQAMLDREQPLHLDVVIDEGALHRQVGGPAVMRRQIERLITSGHRDNITLRVVPDRAGAHKGQMGSFLVVRFPEPTMDPDVVYCDGLMGNTFVEKPTQVEGFVSLFDQLRDLALSPVDTEQYLLQILKGNRG